MKFEDRKRIHRIISVVLFAIYSCVLIYFLFFAENMGRMDTSRAYSFNLVPFREIRRYILHSEALGIRLVLLNVVGNVLAFVPFGLFIIPVLNRRIRFKEAVLLAFDISLFVEIIQLLTKVGSFDIDDVILNTLGGIIGVTAYYIFRVIERLGQRG